MKILVVSDSHLRLDKLIEVYEKENPDIVICTGDHDRDGEELSFTYPQSKYIIVSGNCDYYYSNYPSDVFTKIVESKFFITHGHLYNVKNEYETIYKKGKILGCNVIIFGHTHRQFLDTSRKIKIFNPGAMINGEYGIIILKNSEIEFFHKNL
ncbi:YfcE family phosphodiesterase [Fusobacterium sp. PH5-44]|uniref:YfcE family phosphodiesterase n=1 Tax=unclassified Fusobacterium TaxID=2648384 RepID=UPI003D1E3B53